MADVLALISAVGATWAGIRAKIRGDAADKSAKAADQAVKNLNREFYRRNIFPAEADKYQKMYRMLASVLSKPQSDSRLIVQELGELRGMVNGLDTYLEDEEKGTLKRIIVCLDRIGKEPTAPSHLQALLENTATLSVELDTIVKKIKWNSQSSV